MGFRIVYFDTSHRLPGMLEVIEMSSNEAAFCGKAGAV
jgi:hypothetical protein